MAKRFRGRAWWIIYITTSPCLFGLWIRIVWIIRLFCLATLFSSRHTHERRSNVPCVREAHLCFPSAGVSRDPGNTSPRLSKVAVWESMDWCSDRSRCGGFCLLCAFSMAMVYVTASCIPARKSGDRNATDESTVVSWTDELVESILSASRLCFIRNTISSQHTYYTQLTSRQKSQWPSVPKTTDTDPQLSPTHFPRAVRWLLTLVIA